MLLLVWLQGVATMERSMRGIAIIHARMRKMKHVEGPAPTSSVFTPMARQVSCLLTRTQPQSIATTTVRIHVAIHALTIGLQFQHILHTPPRAP
jgi:hypothetical protein